MLKTMVIIPIHTDSPSTFAKLLSDRWQVLIMKNGNTFRPIKDPSYDNLTAKVLAHKPLTEDIKIVKNPVSFEVWSLDNRGLGEFQREYDAMWTLLHTWTSHTTKGR